MSVFKVALNNSHQGYMDIDPRTQQINPSAVDSVGSQMVTSLQRTIYVAGPNRTYRKLFDGQTFTDCNYWKRFAYPQVPLDQAFISVLTDDGSVYSDHAEENVFPMVWNVTAAGGSVYADNVVDILGDTGGYATFVQITNVSGNSVKVRINGNTNAVFDLGAAVTQVFNTGDLTISKLEFQNNASGATTTTIQVIASVLSHCNS
jgi:hypothetical protein